MALFASPAIPYLTRKLQARNHSAPKQQQQRRTPVEKDLDAPAKDHPLMGLPSDLGGDVEEAVREIRSEVEARRRKGVAARMPTGLDMKAAVKEKLAEDT